MKNIFKLILKVSKHMPKRACELISINITLTTLCDDTENTEKPGH